MKNRFSQTRETIHTQSIVLIKYKNRKCNIYSKWIPHISFYPLRDTKQPKTCLLHIQFLDQNFIEKNHFFPPKQTEKKQKLLKFVQHTQLHICSNVFFYLFYFIYFLYFFFVLCEAPNITSNLDLCFSPLYGELFKFEFNLLIHFFFFNIVILRRGRIQKPITFS